MRLIAVCFLFGLLATRSAFAAPLDFDDNVAPESAPLVRAKRAWDDRWGRPGWGGRWGRPGWGGGGWGRPGFGGGGWGGGGWGRPGMMGWG
ncbi:hypothetical protein Aduo_006587 [Ancylostoma duodenale]